MAVVSRPCRLPNAVSPSRSLPRARSQDDAGPFASVPPRMPIAARIGPVAARLAIGGTPGKGASGGPCDRMRMMVYIPPIPLAECDTMATKQRRDWVCQECGRLMTLKQAERASFGPNGCPGCGGSDIEMVSVAYYDVLAALAKTAPK